MLKTFVYRLYPSKPQARRLDSTLETCRRWYNQCLAERRDAYQQRGETAGKFAQLAKVKEYKALNPHAKGIHSHVLQVVVSESGQGVSGVLPTREGRRNAGVSSLSGA
ncbi:helix-turn-helix domain-containing protein [Roseiflexus castenholzii]|uniref:helix-turn-helix domain-containing protein n=1 Tax=Roseiflexus castenholzii TaxID=120962 RepID=UPI002356EE64